MALSKAVMKAQDIISCSLCELETKLKWKCLDCDLLMCDKCNDKIHPKFKNANEHTKVDIKEVGLGDGNRILNFANIKCKAHPTQSCCLFCSNCDDLVCPICIAKIHAGHTFIETKEAYDMKLKKLMSLKLTMENSEKGLANDESELHLLKISENFKGEKVLQDIEAQKEALIKHADQLSKKVQQKVEKVKDLISIELVKVIDSRQKVKEGLSKLEDLISFLDPKKIFENIDSVERSLETAMQTRYLHQSCIPKFMPRKITESLFGSLNMISSSETADKIEIKVNKQFITDLKYCRHVTVCSDGSFWIGDESMKVLQKIMIDGDKLKTIFTINSIKIRNIAVTADDDLLLADTTSSLKLINGTSGNVCNSKYCVDELYIMSFHESRDHKVIVGAMSPGKVIPVKGRRAVIVMDQEGKQENVYEFDKNKQRLLTYPKSITSISNGTIFVADYTRADENNSKILALTDDLNSLMTYNGHPDINNINPFKPNSIASTPFDNIIISDVSLNAFHIIDSCCNLISYYETSNIGIEYPYSLFLSSASTFYLGCSQRTDSTTKAKLYEIEYSGF